MKVRHSVVGSRFNPLDLLLSLGLVKASGREENCHYVEELILGIPPPPIHTHNIAFSAELRNLMSIKVYYNYTPPTGLPSAPAPAPPRGDVNKR